MRNGGEQSVGHRNTSQLAEEGREAPRNLECAELGGDIVGRRGLLRIMGAGKRQNLEIARRSSCGRSCCSASRTLSAVLAPTIVAITAAGSAASARRPLLDMMAEPGQQRRDVANRRGDLGIDGIAIGRLVGEGDAQPAGIAADLLRERPLRRRRDIGARCLRAVDRIQHGRAVAYADAHDMAAGKAAPAFAAIGTERIARPGRLQSEHAGSRSGNADRAAAIAGMRHGKDARGDRRGRAAGRASGGMRQIPRIAGRAEQPDIRWSAASQIPGVELLPKIVTPASRKRWARVPV